MKYFFFVPILQIVISLPNYLRKSKNKLTCNSQAKLKNLSVFERNESNAITFRGLLLIGYALQIKQAKQPDLK